VSGAEKGCVGIVDWGIGGTGIYRLLKERRPETPVVYLSDTGVMPYGQMGRQELRERLIRVREELVRRGATHLVVACNAASTALPELSRGDLPIVGMIEPAVRALVRLEPRKAGLIGGRRTVLSGIFRRELERHGIAVRSRVSQPLSARIEDGDTGSPELEAECRRILAPLYQCSHVLLACTHYPAILPLLRRYVSPQTLLVDPARAVVDEILSLPDLPEGGGSGDRFLTTGDERAMRRAVRNAFGVEIEGAQRIAI
jgi:glutamate racemase